VVSVEPTNDSYAVKRSTPIRLTFDQALDPATVTTANVQLRDGANQLVPRTVAFESARRAIRVTPTTSLNPSTEYSVVISASVKDVRGISLPSSYSWSFTTGAAGTSVDLNQGAGGPVLIVTAPNDPYGKYYAEILRTEGIPYFDVADTMQLSAGVLNQYVSVLLAPSAISQAQADMLNTWVQAGGNLIAMRPDKKLAGLLGLTDAATTETNQYLRVDPSTAAGAGIVSQSMQYKGTADHYAVSDATVIARLYSDATTASTYPAVTTRIVGSGSASAFSYDLARSVIGLHQGNQLWAGQDRNGDGVWRTNDLFFGAKLGDTQADWLDQTKMAIPQADEQQRLLVNLMTEGMRAHLPAPRFWYLPDEHKAALVLAGDDHDLQDNEGTRQRFASWLNESPIGCSVADWQCVRASHYVYTGSALTNAQAAQAVGYGFEIGDHPSDSKQCSDDRTYAGFYAQYATDLTVWRAKYSSVPQPVSSRFHCYAWNDWDIMPRADQTFGVKYDLNTVAYPLSWISSRSPMVTGSGMNMRLTDASGALLDVHQGVTNFDNTSADSTAIAAMFDNAVGVNGYYGLFGSHYDMGPNDPYHDTLVALAKSRHIPIISAAQALEWLTSREQSTISQLESPATGQVTFRIAAAEGAHGLRAMVPLRDAGGTVTELKRDGQVIPYQTETIKGVAYVVFAARAGSYDVRYSDYGQGVASTPSQELSAGASVKQMRYQASATATAPEAQAAQVENQATVTTPRDAQGLMYVIEETNSPHFNATPPWYNRPITWVIGAGALVATGSAGWWLLAFMRRRV
jgi:hypothetical protein